MRHLATVNGISPGSAGGASAGSTEVKRLFNVLTRTVHDLAHHLRWA
jgi:hypothetical protein